MGFFKGSLGVFLPRGPVGKIMQNHELSQRFLFPLLQGIHKPSSSAMNVHVQFFFWLWLSPMTTMTTRIPFDPPPKQNVSHHQDYDIFNRESLQTFICHDCILGGGFSSKIPAGAIKSGDPSKVVGGNYRQLLVWSSQSVSSQNLGLLNTSIHGLDHRWRWPYLLTQLG